MIPTVFFALHFSQPLPMQRCHKLCGLPVNHDSLLGQAFTSPRGKLSSSRMVLQVEKTKHDGSDVRVRLTKVPGPEDRDLCMGAATVRCAAFYCGPDKDAGVFINRRFSLFQVVKDRMAGGASCLVARICEPFTMDVLKRIGESAELCQEQDRRALDSMRQLEKKVAEGHTTEIQAEAQRNWILEDWRTASLGKGTVVGAVDISTHEFRRSEVWKRDRKAKGAKDMYLSDMAVHPAFRRLGIGQKLLAAALEQARAEGYTVMHLHVEQKNAAAISVYEAGGFRIVEEDEVHKALSDALLFPPGSKNFHMSVDL